MTPFQCQQKKIQIAPKNFVFVSLVIRNETEMAYLKFGIFNQIIITGVPLKYTGNNETGNIKES